MASDHKVKLTAPQASMIIWNYKNRSSSANLDSPHDTEPVFLLAADIVSIHTSKSKSSPSGRFEVRLAPTVNWISKITPGSWCIINMTQDIIIPNQNIPTNTFADENMLKWVGRIEDVRVTVDVDQATGARQTAYIMTGSDWGGVFETNLYIDPIARNNIPADTLASNTIGGFQPISGAARIFYDKQTLDYIDKHNGSLPSSTINTKAIIRTWGAPLTGLADDVQQKVGLVLTSASGQGMYRLPLGLVLFLKQPINIPLAEMIHVISGKLKKQDDHETEGLAAYEDTEESGGFIDPNTIFGNHSFWQLLVDNCNIDLNELIADMRFEKGIPRLALYKRIRPFVMNPDFEDKDKVTNLISEYKNVRRIKIPLEEVINMHAGTNWRDLINFIEVRPNQQLTKEIQGSLFKIDSQTYDARSFERDGFKPKFPSTKYLPFNTDKQVEIADFVNWKIILREWYFNQHAQLNGSMTFIGQNIHIQVGDNIMVDSKVLGVSQNTNSNEIDRTRPSFGEGKSTFLTAHIESIDHDFSVNSGGARSFVSTVRFVRGMITDEKGVPLSKSGTIGESMSTAVDIDATDQTAEDETNINVNITSTPNDPTGPITK